MKAATWCGIRDVHVETTPDPKILNPRDIVMRVTATTICGSDLHLYDGMVPAMVPGDILGHEPVGEVVEVGSAIRDLKVGDRVAVCSIIGCGGCWYCKRQEFSFCDNSNPHAGMIEKLYNHSPAGILGYSQLFGGYAGAQAQYLRVPYADVNAFRIPDGVNDAQAVSITDAMPTGFQGADLLGLEGGETVAVWGAGPVGLCAMKAAWLLGAGRVIAIDFLPERLQIAAEQCNAEVINFKTTDVPEKINDLTAGRGADCCIEACGMESHGTDVFMQAYDRVKQTLMLQTDRGHTIRQIIQCCRKGGRVSIMGVFAMVLDKFPLGAAFNKGLQFRMGQQHGQRYMPQLFELTQQGKLDPGFVFTHEMSLDDASRGYEMFRTRNDDCVKILLRPWM